MSKSATAQKADVKTATAERTKDDKGRFTDVTARENLESLMAIHKNKSATIRYLHAQSYSPSSIAKFLNIRYQFVNNVIKAKPKRTQTA